MSNRLTVLMTVLKQFLFALMTLALTSSASAGIWNPFSGPVEKIGPAETGRPVADLYLPVHRVSQPLPLIILLHGYSGTAERTVEYFDFRSYVGQKKFLLLSPQGKTDSKGYPFWNATDFCSDLDHTGVDDVGYLLKLIDDVKSRHSIDTNRIYLIGHSNGGFMVNRLLCERPDLFAAGVSLAGGTYKNPSDCKRAEAVPYLQIHGVDDPIITYPDAKAYAAGAETLGRRLKTNQCVGVPAKNRIDFVEPMPGAETETSTWACTNGSRRSEVALWLIPNYNGKPGSAHKPALSDQAPALILDWLLAKFRN